MASTEKEPLVYERLASRRLTPIVFMITVVTRDTGYCGWQNFRTTGDLHWKLLRLLG